MHYKNNFEISKYKSVKSLFGKKIKKFYVLPRCIQKNVNFLKNNSQNF